MIRKFTLIELMIVIAILAILVSFLLPSLSKARELSYRAVCLSNMKQSGTVATIYGKNNDFRLNPSSGPHGDIDSLFWLGPKTIPAFEPYVGDWRIMDCPSYFYNNKTLGNGESAHPDFKGANLIGMNYMGGINVNSLVGSGELFEAPAKLVDQNDLILFADRILTPDGWKAQIPHTRNGWFKGLKGEDYDPTSFGSEGGNQLALDLSGAWVHQSQMTGQKGAGNASVRAWWKQPEP